FLLPFGELLSNARRTAEASCMSDSCLQNLITVYCLLTTEKNSHQQCLTDYCLLFTDYCLLFTETTPNT
ncbi:hypothetical protein, partial [Microcystis sp. BLCC-F209]